jgi:hypothetical protein
MTRRAVRPQSPHHILVEDADWAYIAGLFGPSGLRPEVGISPAIRAIIHRWCNQHRQREALLRDGAAQPPLPPNGDQQ